MGQIFLVQFSSLDTFHEPFRLNELNTIVFKKTRDSTFYLQKAAISQRDPIPNHFPSRAHHHRPGVPSVPDAGVEHTDEPDHQTHDRLGVEPSSVLGGGPGGCRRAGGYSAAVDQLGEVRLTARV